MGKNGCVTIGDTDMYYVSFGTGEKKLVVLPGLSDGLATVKGKALLLSSPYKKFFKDYTVYMFSRKNKMPEGYSIRDMAYIAIDHPEMVKKMILAVTAPNANAVVRDAVTGWIDMAMCGDHTALMVDTAERMYSEAYLRKNRRFFPLIAQFTKPRDYDRFLKNANAILRFDAREELAKIICPTLILAGSDDHTVGSDAAQELHDGIAGSQLHVYEGLGHGAFEEAKDFYDRVLAFCNQ